MRLSLLAATALTLIVATVNAKAADGNLWSEGDISVVTTADPDGGLAPMTIVVKAKGKTVYQSDGFLADSTKVVWRRSHPGVGPLVMVGGQTGGSHCGFEVIAISEAPAVDSILDCRDDYGPDVSTDAQGKPHFDVSFEYEDANLHGADSLVEGVPFGWAAGKLKPDAAEMVRPLPPTGKLEEMAKAMRADFSAWKIMGYPPPDITSPADLDAPNAKAPNAVQAMLDLTFSGHAGAAKRLLEQAWPANLPGRDAFWSAFAQTVTQHPMWQQYELGSIVDRDHLLFGDAFNVALLRQAHEAGLAWYQGCLKAHFDCRKNSVRRHCL